MLYQTSPTFVASLLKYVGSHLHNNIHHVVHSIFPTQSLCHCFSELSSKKRKSATKKDTSKNVSNVEEMEAEEDDEEGEEEEEDEKEN